MKSRAALPVAARIRDLVCAVTRNTPMFRGKGRVVLCLDSWLTDSTNAESFMVIERLNHLARFRFDLRPWGQKFAYYYGEWEREHINVIRGLYSGGAFVDIGSSLGLYVVCMGDLVSKAGASILSIEPVPGNLAHQKYNVLLNDYDDLVRYFQIALSSSDGELQMDFDEGSGDNNAIVNEDGELTVPVTTLDKIVRESGCQKIGVIKIDVEGYEPKIIEGAVETIERHRPIVFAEFNRERMTINGFDMTPSWSFFVDFGYKPHQLIDGWLMPLNRPGSVENIYFLPG